MINWFEVCLRNKSVLTFPDILIVTNLDLQRPWLEYEWNVNPESFLAAIWLPYGQLRAILKRIALLTWY